MNTAALITRCLERFEDNSVFWTPPIIVDEGLNPAQLLITLLRPDLLIQRVAVAVPASGMVIDTRQSATRMQWLDRVVVGDVTSATPVRSQGLLYDLRPIEVISLRATPRWALLRRQAPTRFCRWGLHYVLLWPRSVQSHTITLVGRAVPTALSASTPNISPDLPEIWHDLIAEVAVALLILIEGGQEAERGLQRMQELLGEEPFRPILRAVRATMRQLDQTTPAAEAVA